MTPCQISTDSEVDSVVLNLYLVLLVSYINDLSTKSTYGYTLEKLTPSFSTNGIGIFPIRIVPTSDEVHLSPSHS